MQFGFGWLMEDRMSGQLGQGAVGIAFGHEAGGGHQRPVDMYWKEY